MKLILENTSQVVRVNGVPARVWRGRTANGVEVHALITRIAAHKDSDCSQFEQELKEQPAPLDADLAVFPLRMLV